MRARAGKRLQWGRAQMSAEISITAGWEVDKNGLQWGRAQMSAEILSRREAVPPELRFFNGAALR